VQDDPGDEAIAELIAQPSEVSRRGGVGRAGGFDLERDDTPRADLGPYADLLSPLFRS